MLQVRVSVNCVTDRLGASQESRDLRQLRKSVVVPHTTISTSRRRNGRRRSRARNGNFHLNRALKIYPLSMTTTVSSRAPHVTVVAAAGAGLVLISLVLYATELSRATAVVTLAFALCLVGASLLARERGHWPGRPWLIIFGVLVVSALSYGLGLYLYGQLHPPVTA